MGSEAKVGIMFLMVVVLIGGTVYFLGDYAAQLHAYPLTVHFEDVKGLQPGADIQLAGVRIGKVFKIKVEPNVKFRNQPIAVQMSIDSDVDLYKGDRFVIDQTTLIGDTFVGVQRPEENQRPPQTLIPILAGDKEISAAGAAGFSSMPDAAHKLLAEATAAVRDAKADFLSAKNAQRVQLILTNLALTSIQTNRVAVDAGKLVRTLNATGNVSQAKIAQTLEQMRLASIHAHATIEAVDQLVKFSPLPQQAALSAANIRQASEELRQMATEVHEMTTGEETRTSVKTAVANLAAASANIENMTASLQQMTGDEALHQNLKDTVANLKDASASVKRITEHTEGIVTDPTFTEDIQASAHNVREATGIGVEVARKADATLTRVDRTMDSVSALTRAVQPDRITATATLEATQDRGLRADLNLLLQYGVDPRDFWLLGVRDLGDSEQLNLQRSFPSGNRGALRVGIIGSKLGLGYNYSLSRVFSLEAELYNPNNPFLDARGIIQLGHDWSLTAGVADALGDADPMIGLRRNIVLHERATQ